MDLGNDFCKSCLGVEEITHLLWDCLVLQGCKVRISHFRDLEYLKIIPRINPLRFAKIKGRNENSFDRTL